ncbi:MAG: ATP-binding cassette domain-containing protein [Planctomycetia bacterium]|nr:ATP-binding cassette domain-containing protein [Planctomycetia bacterium]
MALLALQEVSIGFRGPPLLDGVSFQIDPGERVCLLGRNGTGKTTLLRLIQGRVDPDEGEITRQQGLRTTLLDQEVPADIHGTVFDVVAGGLGQRAQLLTEYHHASSRLAIDGGRRWRDELDRLGHELEIQGGWLMHQEVETVLSRMDLDPDAETGVLSAGMKRRVLLARSLAGRPDILLLDEPTNHLDIEAVAWLEEFLLRHGGTLLFVTHDRMLLRRLATRIFDLDRGNLHGWACDYEMFLQRKEAALAAEAQQQALFDKRLAQEEVWIRRGIMARRTRNEGRVRALEAMRKLRAQRRERPGEVRMQTQQAQRSGRMVIEAKGVRFGYADAPVVDGLSTTILRGDRVGIIGPNGSGKTTLLRVLLGGLRPQQGTLRHGTNLEIAYFDQLQAQLDPEKTVRENVSDGADTLSINGCRRHVIGYLEDFLFTTEQAASPVKYLSGGEHNRLLLARLFAKPSNLLVLDEPTNDLDIETLELLEELLLDYPGTLLLVSHDREFLNNVVTSTLVLEGGGRVKEYAGGYDDWLAQRKPAAAEPVRVENEPPQGPRRERPKPDGPRRLKYMEQRELEALPEKIEVLEAERERLHAAMAEPAFYQQPPAAVVEATARLKTLDGELAVLYDRWEELEGRV